VSGIEVLVVGLIIFALLIPVAVLTVMIFRLRALLSRDQQGETPLRTLQKRYARGEIDEDEYRHRRRVLESTDS
jgi:uncharacterized membrane protein